MCCFTNSLHLSRVMLPSRYSITSLYQIVLSQNEFLGYISKIFFTSSINHCSNISSILLFILSYNFSLLSIKGARKRISYIGSFLVFSSSFDLPVFLIISIHLITYL